MSRPHVSTPTPVGTLLTAALPPLADGLLALTIRREWPSLVGPQISHRAQPSELRAGTLTVVADNSPWLQELTLRERELLSLLQGRYGAESIRGLHFTLGTPARGPEHGDHAPSPENDTLTAEEQAWVAGTASAVGDPALAETVRRLLVKDALFRRRRGAPR